MLYIIAGWIFYGKADQVPGLFYVATRFSHFFFFPIIPDGNFLIVEGPTRLRRESTAFGTTDYLSKHAVSIPFSMKSVLLGWARVALILALVTAIAGFLLLGREAMPLYGAGILLVLVVLQASYLLSKASQARALELGKRLNFPEEMVIDALTSSYSLFGIHLGRKRFHICGRCGTVNNASKPVYRQGQLVCTSCPNSLEEPLKGLVGPILLLAVLVFAIAFWARSNMG